MISSNSLGIRELFRLQVTDRFPGCRTRAERKSISWSQVWGEAPTKGCLHDCNSSYARSSAPRLEKYISSSGQNTEPARVERTSQRHVMLLLPPVPSLLPSPLIQSAPCHGSLERWKLPRPAQFPPHHHCHHHHRHYIKLPEFLLNACSEQGTYVIILMITLQGWNY